MVAAIGALVGHHTEWDAEAWWCPACETPYLVIWPETAGQERQQWLAGFPPKGG